MAVKIFSAGVAACVADVATFPLDTAKVRLQVGSAQGAPRRRGGLDGVRPFDSGCGFTVLSHVR